MWKTALATHEGTSLARYTDVTSYPLVYPDSTVFSRSFYRTGAESTLSKYYAQDKDGGIPSDFTKAAKFANWVLPEYYAFRDGLHIRGTTTFGGSVRTVFTPAPGPVLGDPNPVYRKDASEKDYASSYAGKCINVAPGTLWNVWNRYAGIERGHARGQREGRSILSLGLDLNFTLTPACLDIPVRDVPDSVAASATESGLWYGDGTNSWPWLSAVPNTSYVMPTWAMVLVYSYRSDSKQFVDPDDVQSDTPAHHTNNLSWLKNRNAQVQHDSTGARTLQPAECYMGRLGTVSAGFYRPGIDDPTQNPALVADYNVPFLRSSPIRRPEDVMVDTSKVVVHSYRVVQFPNQATALRDPETTLEHRWATGRQFTTWYDGSTARTDLGQASGYADGTLGDGSPPVAVRNASVSGADGTPGIAVLQRPPRVSPKHVRISMRFNGRRIEFDDDQDDELTSRAVVGAESHLGGLPVSDPQAAAEYVMLQDELGNVITSDRSSATINAVPVVRARMYSDNTAYNNIYATVISPCYKVPVGDITAATTQHTSSAFQVPNWGAVPVKVSMSSNFTFKR